MVCGFKQKFINCIKESNKNSKSANTSEVKKKLELRIIPDWIIQKYQ